MNSNALKATLNRVLRKFGPMDRSAYKRVLARTGDELIGRTTVVKTDTLFDPQPVYQMYEQMSSRFSARTSYLLTASGLSALMPGDYIFTFSPDALSVSDVQNKNVQFVLKDAAGVEEVLSIIGHAPTALNGSVVMMTVYARGEAQS